MNDDDLPDIDLTPPHGIVRPSWFARTRASVLAWVRGAK